MNHFLYHRPQEAYTRQLETLLSKGIRVDVRGRQTLELIHCTTEFTNPYDCCILIPGRRWNPWIALSEGLWILAGRNDVETLLPYNSTITEFSDDGKMLYGAYGARIFHQIDPLIARLHNDPSDRRAVLQIWDDNFARYGEGHDDLTVESKDPPCNNMVYFKIRLGELHMTVINRSNDLHWGLYAVNAPTFQMLQQYIAARLHVRVGPQIHFSDSLHIYIDDSRARTITQHMLAEPENQTYPDHALMFRDLDIPELTHGSFANACSAALHDVPIGSGSEEIFPFLHFARVFLAMYREHDWKPEYLNTNYADWIQAGQNFVDKSTRFQ